MTSTGASDASPRVPESATSLKCCWMLAGVVSYKLCAERYECDTCSFDHAIRNRGARLFADLDSVAAGGDALAAKSLLFHPRHVWARIEGEGRIRTGLDDFGRRLAGHIYCVGLPRPGESVRAGAPAWTIVHHDGEIALASPISGVVEEVNERLRRQPTLANKDPYGDGWSMVISPSDLSGDLHRLRFGAETAAWSAAESEKLLHEIGSPATLMDGGHLVEDLHEAIPAAERPRVLDLFLSATRSPSPDPPERPEGGDSEGR